MITPNRMLHRMDELAEEVQELFPTENVTKKLLAQVYSVCKMNHVFRLLALRNQVEHPPLMKFLINLKFDDYDGQTLTPLTMAVLNGDANFVNVLLTKFDVDMEAECNVIFDGLVVYGATALWVASALGHLQAVKHLVQAGASVNHNTKAQSSPLRAACYEGRVDIVRYLISHGADVNLGNNYNNTCIMIASYKGHRNVVEILLENGANPNDQALCGATALHYAAECGHVEVCRILLKHGARLLEKEHNLTPVLTAAERTHEKVVNLFINWPKLMNKEEIITATELLGASYANDKQNDNVNKAWFLLFSAMEMRYSDPENIIRKKVIAPVPAYDNWLETENIQELQAISLNHHSIHMEALTIRERILGKKNPDLPQPLIYRGAVMADQGRFSQCQALWNYAIDLKMNNNIAVDRDLFRFAQLFSQILRLDKRSELNEVLSVLLKCQKEIFGNNAKIKNPGPKDVPQLLKDQNEQNIFTALYLIKIITKLVHHLKSQLPSSEIARLHGVILKFIKNDVRLQDGQTLLHLSVNAVVPVDEFYHSELFKFPCAQTALILVHAGSSVTTVDSDRNTPLHTLASSVSTKVALSQARQSTPISATGLKIVKMFVDAGAHLDAVNADGKTAADLSRVASITDMLRSYANSSITLKCLASRCIAHHHIEYKGQIPVVLEEFVEMHTHTEGASN